MNIFYYFQFIITYTKKKSAQFEMPLCKKVNFYHKYIL